MEKYFCKFSAISPRVIKQFQSCLLNKTVEYYYVSSVPNFAYSLTNI